MRLWADHRVASVISLALLVLGLLIKPWTLVLVLLVCFGGPLLTKLEDLKSSPIGRLAKMQWALLALGLAVVLLALNKGGGHFALIAGLIPMAWVFMTDRSLLTSSTTTKGKIRKRQSQDPSDLQEGLTPELEFGDHQTSEADSMGGISPPLTGNALLDKIKELGDVGKSDIVRSCGYVGKRPDGTDRLNFTAFYEALLEAKGIDTTADSSDEEDDVDDASETSSSHNQQIMNLPADWAQLDSSETVDRLKDQSDISAEVLTALASSDDWEVRRAVAWHDNTPDAVIKALSNDDDSDVRQAIGDRSLPKDWRFLTQDEKVTALQSSEISPNIIEALASSENWSLRQAVAWSPSASDSVLDRLKEDDDEDVQLAASKERLLPVEWRFLPNWEKAERLAEQTVDESILSILASARASEVRRAVALHPGTKQDLLDKLAEDDDSSVQSGVRERALPNDWKALDDDDRIAALREPGITEAVLRILAGSGNWSIRQAVALSPSAPTSILEQLLNDEDADVQSAVRERELPEDWRALDDDEKVERLNGGEADAAVLTILAKSGRWDVRQAVAQNPATADDLLRQLAEDDDDDVQSAAKKNLKQRGQSTGHRDSTTPWNELFSVDTSEENFERSPFENVPHLLDPIAEGERLVLVNLGVIEEECDEYLMQLSSHVVNSLPGDCTVQEGSHVAVIVSHGKARVVLGWKIPEDREALLVDLKKEWSEAKVNGEKCFDEAFKPSFIDYGSTSTSPSEIRFLKQDSTWHICDPNAIEWEDRQSTCLDEDRGTGYYSNYFESREAHPYHIAIICKSGEGYLVEEAPESELPNFKDWIIERLDAPLQPTNTDRSGEDEEHSIYIKTEPAGRIAFGELDSEQIRQLQESISTRELSAELEELRDNSYGTLNECDGVANSGDEGDTGNEGTIVFSEDQSPLGPTVNEESGAFENGVYVVLMRLSKCSIEFEFTAKAGFDADEFEEISVPIRLPDEIIHGLYGHPDFNIITGFRFRGESVEEYEGEVDDRGYDDQLTFFVVKEGATTVLYSNYNGEEEWCDEAEAKAVLSSFL